MKPVQVHSAVRERRKVIGQTSRELVREVSTQSDRWFLSSLAALDRSMQWTDHRISSVVRRMLIWRRPRRPRDRILELLRKEAKRARGGLPEQDFVLFAERLGTLVELVLSGAVAIEDIAFEGERASALAGEAPTEQGALGE